MVGTRHGQLFFYHLRLAGKSLRRDVGLSAAIAIGVLLATSIFTVTVLHFLRLHGPKAVLPASLHQVELPHPGAFGRLSNGGGWTSGLAVRTRITYPERQILAASTIPTRQFSTFRARLLVSQLPANHLASEGEARAPHVAMVRFVNGDFFAMFDRRFRVGAPWTVADEAAGAPVAVLGLAQAQRLFGDRDPRGSIISIDGRPHRVVGVLAEHQPFWTEWDISAFGIDQDAVYLPFANFIELRARPDMAARQTASGDRFEDLLTSDAVFITHWVDLPGAQVETAYRDFLSQKLGPTRASHTLRSLAEWRATMVLPETGAKFFTLLTFVLLLGGAFNMMRLLLAKGLARTEEIGIYRALGAPRGAIFGRHMLEAALLVLPAAVAGTLLSLPYIALWNRMVADTDIPLSLTGLGFCCSAGISLSMALLATLYPAWRMASVPCTISVARR
jgi:putative ABC transport system permease protein